MSTENYHHKSCFPIRFSNNNNNNNVPGGSCPAVNSLPNLASCDGMESNCWSVGQPDVDCPGNALCCFDGCRNACYFQGRVKHTAVRFYVDIFPFT